MLKLEDLSVQQKSLVCNGFGSQQDGFNPPSLIFGPSADDHDFSYWAGGTEKQRWKADFKFYIDCLKLIFGSRKYYLYPVYFGVATVYYIGLVLFGWLVWEYSTRPANKWKEIQIRINYHNGKHPENPYILPQKKLLIKKLLLSFKH